MFHLLALRKGHSVLSIGSVPVLGEKMERHRPGLNRWTWSSFPEALQEESTGKPVNHQNPSELN